MDLEVKNNSSGNVSAVTEADREPPVLVKDSPHSDEDTARVLAEKHGVEFIRLSETQLSPQVVQIIPQWLATRHNIIAVKFEEDTLYVAMTNPVDLSTLDEINLVTSFNVEPVVATERDIIQAIGQHYSAEQMTRQDLTDVRVDTKPALEVDEEAEDLTVSDETNQVVRLVNSVIRNAIDSRASDIHFEPVGEEIVVRLRVDGTFALVRTDIAQGMSVQGKAAPDEKTTEAN